MIRLFKTHCIRKIEELDGMWDFLPENGEKKYTMPVPSCWEQHPDFASYRGKASYKKTVYVDAAGPLRFEFKGVSHTADVYFDGICLGHHYNAFTPFSFIVQHAEKGDHELKVIVDNAFTEQSSLHIPNDYYSYGGITRPVSFEHISNVYIQGIHFTPYKKNNSWYGKIDVTLQNTAAAAVSVSLKGKLKDLAFDVGSICVDGLSSTSVSVEREFPGVESWSHDNPVLYLLNIVLYQDGKALDDLIERIGFRTVEFTGGKIKLNGETVFLKGFNRHEDYASAGCAIPLQLMVHDMDIMQDLGVNALRTSHYPNDERFLDLCDERGILVWEENHARGLSLEAMKNSHFDQQCKDCIDEMIFNHYNHPGIIIWGILNECSSDTQEGKTKYKTQFEQIRKLDQSRPVTSATCKHFTDITLELQDIVSYNIYSGWYKDVPIKQSNDEELEWIQNAGGKGKPVIVSEFGAGAIYGYRDRSRCKWSEERQSDILDACLETYMNDPRICGVFIWQYADCRITEEDNWFASRPRSHNNKGIVDEYRRPKMAYDIVKARFEGKK